MIGRIQGILLETQISPGMALIDVHGLAYEVEIPFSTLERLPVLGGNVMLHTHMVVREDAQILFGFAEYKERQLFRALIRINSVGPKLALAILSGMEPDRLLRALQQGDVAALTRIPGIGKKTAERLIIELRDRLDGFGTPHSTTDTLPLGSADPQSEAEAALITLGYKPADALRALKQIEAPASDTAGLIRQALRQLNREGS